MLASFPRERPERAQDGDCRASRGLACGVTLPRPPHRSAAPGCAGALPSRTRPQQQPATAPGFTRGGEAEACALSPLYRGGDGGPGRLTPLPTTRKWWRRRDRGQARSRPLCCTASMNAIYRFYGDQPPGVCNGPLCPTGRWFPGLQPRVHPERRASSPGPRR